MLEMTRRHCVALAYWMHVIVICAQTHEVTEFRLLLIGNIESGKSATGNTILGEHLLHEHSSRTQSVTKNGVTIEITETPSLPASNKDMDDGLTGIMFTMATMQTGPDAILFVINFDLFDKEQNKIVDAYDALKDTFGEDISNYLVFAVAQSDTLERNYRTVEDVKAVANVYFRKIIDEVNDRLLVINNFAENRQTQVDRLLGVVREMKDFNGHAPYFCWLCLKAKSLAEKEMMNMMEPERTGQDTVNDLAARQENKIMRKSKEVLMQEKETRKWAKDEEKEDIKRWEEVRQNIRDLEESKRSTNTDADHRKLQEEIEDIKRQIWMEQERRRWKDEIIQLSNKASLALEKENQKQMEKEREKYWNKAERESVYKHQKEVEAIKRQEIARYQNPGWKDIICSILKKLFGFNC